MASGEDLIILRNKDLRFQTVESIAYFLLASYEVKLKETSKEYQTSQMMLSKMWISTFNRASRAEVKKVTDCTYLETQVTTNREDGGSVISGVRTSKLFLPLKPATGEI